MKWLKNAISGIRLVLKYASFVMVVLSVLGFTANEFEKWQKENLPDGEGDK